jgi:nitroreductase
VLNARRSTRAFLSVPVEKDKLTAVLEVAVRTPSWSISQPWEVFVATGDTLDRIRKGYQYPIYRTLKKAYDDAVIAGRIEVAQNMLAKDMDKKLISEVSGLPMEQINTLKNNIGNLY